MSDSVKKHRIVIYTIGHSTRPIDKFIDLLAAHGITRLVDIRTVPKSRHNPQFNAEALRESLNRAGISYEHSDRLSGFRKPRKDSVNLGWENLSFRGFADYMRTPKFEGGLRQLMKEAAEEKMAIMCAEAVPWRCHRSLVADAIVKWGGKTFHIQSRKTAALHKLTPFLKMKEGKLIYPVPKGQKIKLIRKQQSPR